MQQSLDLWLHSIAPHHHHLGIFDRILQALDLSRYIENMIHFWSVMLSTQFLMMPQQIEPVLSTLDYLGPVSHSQPVETDSSSLRPWDLSPHKHSVWNRSPESVIELASWECRVHVNQAILGLNLELTLAQLALNSGRITCDRSRIWDSGWDWGTRTSSIPTGGSNTHPWEFDWCWLWVGAHISACVNSKIVSASTSPFSAWVLVLKSSSASLGAGAPREADGNLQHLSWAGGEAL